MPITTCVFDAYGTLFDVAAAARRAAAEPGRERFAEDWQKIAEVWRQKQLSYSWLRAITGEHADFWSVTGNALDYALAAAGLGGDAPLRECLLALYWELDAFPEVPPVLAALRNGGLNTAILSNGAPGMLRAAVDHAGIGEALDAILSVEDVRVFKPHRSVYDLVGRRFGCAPAAVLFVSSNGWDAAAATGYGFETVWVNRANDPVERLPWRPAHELPDLTGVPALAGAR